MSNGSLEVMQNVSANLRQARQQQGYSQERLAERAGISRRMLVNIEAGESNASIATWTSWPRRWG
ncbi:helix-turn-helix domain-containing protein [Aquitalea magnusonii]|uniref:helix-turn-helix domain-containing protein n=1 Tax=Aquitalea magnusonii TaxID=332411 RepID=UPI000A6B639D|nr:helix-turn-helix transcriptional regulator [Aquitalea magnusonii]